MRQQKEVTENQYMQIKTWTTTRGHKRRKSGKQQVRSELATQVDSKSNGDFKISGNRTSSSLQRDQSRR